MHIYYGHVNVSPGFKTLKEPLNKEIPLFVDNVDGKGRFIISGFKNVIIPQNG